MTDKEPPRIDRCVAPPTFITKDQYANVTWDEPIFSDNSQEEVTVTSSHEPGPFPHGEVSVVFVAVDSSGNNNSCTLTIEVKGMMVISAECMYPARFVFRGFDKNRQK